MLNNVSPNIFLDSKSINMTPVVSAEWNNNLYNMPYVVVSGDGTFNENSIYFNSGSSNKTLSSAITSGKFYKENFTTKSFTLDAGQSSSSKLTFSFTSPSYSNAFKVILYAKTDNLYPVLFNTYADGYSSKSYEVDNLGWTKIELYVGSESFIPSFNFIINASNTVSYAEQSNVYITSPEIYSITLFDYKHGSLWSAYSPFKYFRPGESYVKTGNLSITRPNNFRRVARKILSSESLSTTIDGVDYYNNKYMPISPMTYNPNFFLSSPPVPIYKNGIPNDVAPYQYFVSSDNNSEKQITAKYEKDIYSNKIVLKFNTLMSIPTVSIFLDGNNIGSFGKDTSVTDEPNGIDKNGVLTLYWSGTAWTTTRWTTQPTFNATGGIDKSVKFRRIRVLQTNSEIVSQFNTGSYSSISNDLKRLQIIEISPRLEVDLTNFVETVSISKSLDDKSQDVPISVINSNDSSVVLSNIPLYTSNGPLSLFSNNSDLSHSILSNMLNKNVKFYINFKIDYSKNQDFDGTDKYVPGGIFYADTWTEEENSVSVNLFDITRYLQTTPVPDYAANMKDVFETITNIFDLAGFTDYDYDSLYDVCYDPSIPLDFAYYYCNSLDTTILQALAEICLAYQIGAYIDEYGIMKFISLSKVLNVKSTTATYSSGGAAGATSVVISASNSNIIAGMSISGTGFATNTFVTSVSGTTINFSPAATGQVSGTITFGKWVNIGDDDIIDNGYSITNKNKVGKISLRYQQPQIKQSLALQNATDPNIRKSPSFIYTTSNDVVWSQQNIDSVGFNFLNASMSKDANSFTLNNNDLLDIFHTYSLNNNGYAIIENEIVSFVYKQYTISKVSDANPETVVVKNDLELAAEVNRYIKKYNIGLIQNLSGATDQTAYDIKITPTGIISNVKRGMFNTIVKDHNILNSTLSSKGLSQSLSGLSYSITNNSSNATCDPTSKKIKIGSVSQTKCMVYPTNDFSNNYKTFSTSFDLYENSVGAAGLFFNQSISSPGNLSSSASSSYFVEIMSYLHNPTTRRYVALAYYINGSSANVIAWSDITSIVNEIERRNPKVLLRNETANNVVYYTEKTDITTPFVLRATVYQESADNGNVPSDGYSTLRIFLNNIEITGWQVQGDPNNPNENPWKSIGINSVTKAMKKIVLPTTINSGTAFGAYASSASPFQAIHAQVYPDLIFPSSTSATIADISEIYATQSSLIENSVSYYFQDRRFLDGVVQGQNITEQSYMMQTKPKAIGLNYYDVQYPNPAAVNVDVLPIEYLWYYFPGNQPEDQKWFQTLEVNQNALSYSTPINTGFRAKMMVANNAPYLVFLNKQSDELNQFDISFNLWTHEIIAQSDQEIIEKVVDKTNSSESVSIESEWIQSRQSAERMLSTIGSAIDGFSKDVSIDIFGNLLIQIGDVVNLTYPLANIKDQKYFVHSVSHSFDNGLQTRLLLNMIEPGTKHQIVPSSSQFKVTYNGNNNTAGSVPIDSNFYQTGNTVTILGNTGSLEKTGSSFESWNANENGTGAVYIPGSTFTMGSSDITLYAKWSQTSYTILYNGNGNDYGNAPVDYNFYSNGSAIVVADQGTLTKSGFIFTGWNTAADGSGTHYDIASSIDVNSANIVLYAEWSQKRRVFYYGNGNTGGTITDDFNLYTNGDTVTVLSAGSITKQDNIFIGWNTSADGSGTMYDPADTFIIGSSDVSLYAQWIASYTVTYNGNGNTSGVAPIDSNVYGSGASVTVSGIGTLAKTESIFVGWNTAANGSGTMYEIGDTFLITSSTTLYAQWSSIYNITYNGNTSTSGTVPVDSNNYGTGDIATVLGNTGSLQKTGYRFMGWNTAANGSGVSYSAGNTITIQTSPITLYAQWAQEFTLTYSGNGNTSGTAPVDSGQYISGESTTVLGQGALLRTDYAFTGWNTAADGSGTSYSQGNTLAFSNSNITLYAQWSPQGYIINYYGNSNTGGTAPVDTAVYQTGNTITVLSEGTLTKGLLGFTEWNTAADGSGTSYSPGNTITVATSNINLYAQWQTGYTITYNGNTNSSGTAPVDTQVYPSGYSVTVLTAGTLLKIGHQFAGWNTAADGSGTSYAASSTLIMPSSNVTLYAQWVQVYTVTYNGNGNTGGTVPVDSTLYYYNDPVTVLDKNTLVKTSAAFAGWNTAADGSGTSYAHNDVFLITSNTILYAQWTISYSITYNANTGSNPPVDTNAYAPGNTATILGAGSMTKANNDFISWNTLANGTGTTYNPGDTLTITSNITLYAQWKPFYLVTYNANGGTGTAPTDTTKYYTGDTVTVLGFGTLDQTTTYASSWNTLANGTGTAYQPGNTFIMGSANIILYARYTLKPSISYNNNGGTGTITAQSFIKPGSTATLSSGSGFSRTNFKLVAWNTQSDGLGTTYSLSGPFVMPFTDVILYAVWALSYSISYNSNGGTGTAPTDSNRYAVGETATVLSRGFVYRTGYAFSGWNTASNGTGTMYAAGSGLTMITGGVILYAIWTLTPPTITSTTYSPIDTLVGLNKINLASGTTTNGTWTINLPSTRMWFNGQNYSAIYPGVNGYININTPTSTATTQSATVPATDKIQVDGTPNINVDDAGAGLWYGSDTNGWRMLFRGRLDTDPVNSVTVSYELIGTVADPFTVKLNIIASSGTGYRSVSSSTGTVWSTLGGTGTAWNITSQ